MGHLEDHLRWCELRNLRPATIHCRRLTINRVERTIGVELHEATPDEVIGWWMQLATCPEARAVDLSHVRQYCQWLQREGIRADDPTVRIYRPLLRQRLPRPIAEDDLAVAIAFASDRVRPWFLLAGYCGLRAGEICQLRGEDLIDQSDGPVVFIADGKSKRQRIVPITERVRDEIPWPADGWVFPRYDDRPGHVPAHRVSHLANRELRALGITATLHQLRHRFATEVYRATLDLRLTQDLLGHQSPITTSRYAAWAPGAARAAVDAIV